ncbi:allantoinase AllB [Mariniblastus fucicola]|uniref:allantoinase n=1 Tax=Mariniblastus fucicola TaxID=980251 RepID=A0A5B9P318_9BACT|nr:allantoinase AllB [Mariniblastus fucicola]QEG20768.1 Allantoinase [Mariniblastus fucicola]
MDVQNPIAIKSSRVVTPEGEISAVVLIENGQIRQVLASELAAETTIDVPVVDFGDLIVSPGLIDSHVHINDPGTDWEGFETATAAAAAGGITTLIDMPLNSLPVTTTADFLDAKRDAAKGRCHVDVGFYGGLIPGNADQLPLLIESGVFGIKAFLCDSGLDEFPAAGETELRAALVALKSTGVPLLAHAEIATTSPQNFDRRYADYAQSRPPEFELAAIRLLIDLCREFQTPVHIVHLATALGLPLVAAAKEQGLPLTVETCPHYLFFSADDIVDGDTRYKCAPPIRSLANRDALREAVASGLIDTVGSDHSPCPPELKRLDEGDFSQAWGGIAGLQLTLPVIWSVGRENRWTPSMLANRLSSKPAEVFGLSNKGQIAVGFDADLVVWDPNQRFTVEAKSLRHRHKVSPYDGVSLTGAVRCTFLRGQCVFDSQVEEAETQCGQLLQRSAKPRRIAQKLNSLDDAAKFSVLETCCASKAWIKNMLACEGFRDDEDVFAQARSAAESLTEGDWLEAFVAHPRIGNVDSLRKKYANTKQVASGEQAGVSGADDATLNRLAEGNDEYFEKFGFIFIVCATGKSAAQMLELLQQRLGNDRQTELRIAAEEQLKITIIRLKKLVA